MISTHHRSRGARRRAEHASVRVGVLTAAPALLRSLGVDSAEILEEAGLASGLLGAADNLISFRARGRLLSLAVARSGCEHFGLLLGQQGRLSHFGLVGFLVQHSPDVGTALRNLDRYLHLHVRGAAPTLTVMDRVAALGYEIHERGVEGREQLEDAAIAFACSILRSLCGADWNPDEAVFAHRRPEDVGPFSRFFRAPLRFDAGRSAVVFPAEWLNRPLPAAEAGLRLLLQRQIDALDGKQGANLPERVRSVLRTAILTGHGTVEDVAPMFSLHSRSLHRRLSEFGVTFKELADEIRFEIARRMLEESATPISQIADALDYADASAFTRAFRRWTKATPAAWRDGRTAGGRRITRRWPLRS